MEYDSEILYVQKLYFFIFLATFSLLVTAIIILNFNWYTGFYVLAIGLAISYLAMVLKKRFKPPEIKLTARRMAHAISQDTSPLSIACFASQLYYYLHEPAQAISLLEKFQPGHDPLLCTTLGDILLKEGQAKQALYILRGSPYASVDPLVLATQGKVLKKIGEISEAVKMFEQSLLHAKHRNFPHSGAPWITQRLLTISYIASIHHMLADCYVILENFPQAKLHYRAGNRLLLDVSLWRHCPHVRIIQQNTP